MWAFMATQAQNVAGVPSAVWVGLALLLPSVLVLALMTVVRREFRSEYPNVSEFGALKREVDEIPALIQRTDHAARDNRNAEFGRLRDSIDSNNRELRELIRELRQIIEKLREDNAALATRFELHKQASEMRLDLLERDAADTDRRRA